MITHLAIPVIIVIPSNKELVKRATNKLIKWAKLTQESKTLLWNPEELVNQMNLIGYEAEFANRMFEMMQKHSLYYHIHHNSISDSKGS